MYDTILDEYEGKRNKVIVLLANLLESLWMCFIWRYFVNVETFAFLRQAVF